MSDEPREQTSAEKVGEEQIAFDIHAFPGGVRSAIEAVLMVVDEPVSEVTIAAALELRVEDVLAQLAALEEDYAQSRRGFPRIVSATHCPKRPGDP